MNIILRKPIITEKSMKLIGSGLYAFKVDKNSTKPQIAKAVANQFKVEVVKVKTINVKGEIKMQKRVRKSYQTSGFKKALVQLKKGQKIAIFEQAPKEKDEVTVTTAEGEPTVLKERKDLFRRTKVRVEKGPQGAAPTTQRKVITGK
ncbi:MAG: large subunit ribosomal protein L23 [Microgenomates group bacterium Gr01-1014_80]|nr:MAG: large subunit ribosomal protein L23 [Microgenomates group bacterium Gr01-1014_80]